MEEHRKIILKHSETREFSFSARNYRDDPLFIEIDYKEYRRKPKDE